MVLLLPKARSTAEEFGETFGGGVGQGFTEAREKANLLRQQSQENAQIKQNYGIDLSGIRDPKMREQAFSEIIKQQGKRLTPLQESQKALADERLKALQGQQELFGRLIGGKRSQEETGMAPEGQDIISSIPEDNLRQLSAFAGQPGQEGIIGNIAKAEIERRKHEREISPEFKREQHLTKEQAVSDVKYNTQLQEASKQHELKERTLDRLEQLNKKGVTGKPWEKLAEKVGLVNITSEGRREFAADVKNLITDIRSILGAQFTGFEFQTILNAYPSADFSKEANSAIIKNLKEFQDIKKKEVEFAQQLKKENKGRIPEDFQSKVNERVREYASSRIPEIKENTRKIMNEEYGIPEGFTLMFDPEGNEMSVPEQEVVNMLESGATLP